MSTPPSTMASLFTATPSASKDCERRPRLRRGSSMMRMLFANSCCAELVLQEAGLARDRGAVDRADEMADQRIGDPRVEDDGHLAGLDLARIGARHRALACLAADAARASPDRSHAAPRCSRSRAPCRCLRPRSPSWRCPGSSADRSRGSRSLVTSTMPPMPAEADAPPDLVTPFTARPAASASCARRSSSATRECSGSSRSRSGKIARQQRGIGKPDIFVVGRHARHRHRALGKFRDAVAADVVGRDHRLALPDQYAQADIVAFGALGFLDMAVAHLDPLRDAAHRDRVGGIRAGALCGLDQPLGQRRERGLIEQVGVRQFSSKASKRRMVKSSRTKSLTFDGGAGAKQQTRPDVPDWRGLQAFSRAKNRRFSAARARSRQSCKPRSCQSWETFARPVTAP